MVKKVKNIGNIVFTKKLTYKCCVMLILMVATRPLKWAYNEPCKYNSFGNNGKYLII